jgi:hypothetical protein
MPQTNLLILEHLAGDCGDTGAQFAVGLHIFTCNLVGYCGKSMGGYCRASACESTNTRRGTVSQSVIPAKSRDLSGKAFSEDGSGALALLNSASRPPPGDLTGRAGIQ